MTSTDDRYNGWTNRETWAVALYINNDQGWQEQVHEALTAGPYASEGFTLEEARQAFFNAPRYIESQAGQLIRENVEQMITVDGYAEMTGEKQLPAELSRIAEDIGSLYRVNWDEIGANFLTDLADQ